jgi:hypothetical protein
MPGLLLTVLIANVGLVQAVGPAHRMVAPGDTIRMRLDPAGSAIVRDDRPRAEEVTTAELGAGRRS